LKITPVFREGLSTMIGSLTFAKDGPQRDDMSLVVAGVGDQAGI
jgi:hypothetical protein